MRTLGETARHIHRFDVVVVGKIKVLKLHRIRGLDAGSQEKTPLMLVEGRQEKTSKHIITHEFANADPHNSPKRLRRDAVLRSKVFQDTFAVVRVNICTIHHGTLEGNNKAAFLLVRLHIFVLRDSRALPTFIDSRAAPLPFRAHCFDPGASHTWTHWRAARWTDDQFPTHNALLAHNMPRFAGFDGG